MKATLILADYAMVAENKLTVVGGGWCFTGPDPIPSGIGILIEVPWDQTNQKHTWSLSLKDSDGQVWVGPDGNPAQMDGEFETGRPPGHPKGTPINLPVAINLPPFPLTPGSRYVWELVINGEHQWSVAFNVRPRPGPVRMAG